MPDFADSCYQFTVPLFELPKKNLLAIRVRTNHALGKLGVRSRWWWCTTMDELETMYSKFYFVPTEESLSWLGG